jgi:hypothetical protein
VTYTEGMTKSGTVQSEVVATQQTAFVSVSECQALLHDAALLPSLINLTSGRRRLRLQQYPACGGQGLGRRNHSASTAMSHAYLRFVDPDPPGLIRSWKI